MRAIIKFTKGDEVRFVSHLDMQRLFQRAFKRARLPLAYSQGFNPHPIMSFATALSVGITSSGEYLDVALVKELFVEDIMLRVNQTLPSGVRITEVIDARENKKSLTSAMVSASYSVKMQFEEDVTRKRLLNALEELLSNEIVVMKRTKGGVKPIDIQPMALNADVVNVNGAIAEIAIKGKLTAEGGLNPEMLINAFYERLGIRARHSVNRNEIEIDWRELL